MGKRLSNYAFDMHYGSNEKCLRALLNARTANRTTCLNTLCNAPIASHYRIVKENVIFDDELVKKDTKAFYCRNCTKQFSPCANTFFSSKIEIKKMFGIIYSMLQHSYGVSHNQLQDDFEIRLPTAMGFAHKVRAQMNICLEMDIDKSYRAIYEIDEVDISVGRYGMKQKNRHTAKLANKNAKVLGMVRRGGGGLLLPIDRGDRDNIIPLITEHIPPGSIISTDSAEVYKCLPEYGYTHYTVNHKKKQFMNGSAGTNSVEGLFSHMRNCFRTYKSVSPQHLPKYLDEIAFRYTYKGEFADMGIQKLLNSLPPMQEITKN